MFVLGQTWANTYHNSLPTGPYGGAVGTEANLAGTSIGGNCLLHPTWAPQPLFPLLCWVPHGPSRGTYARQGSYTLPLPYPVHPVWGT